MKLKIQQRLTIMTFTTDFILRVLLFLFYFYFFLNHLDEHQHLLVLDTPLGRSHAQTQLPSDCLRSRILRLGLNGFHRPPPKGFAAF